MLLVACKTSSAKFEGKSMPIKVGVPQGTICGPLFGLLSLIIMKHHKSPLQNMQMTFHAIGQLHTHSQRKRLLDAISLPTEQAVECIDYGLQWSKQNCMNLNVSKTKLMPISVKKTCDYDDTISVEVVDNFKFLGVTLDRHLNFSTHVRIRIRIRIRYTLFSQ